MSNTPKFNDQQEDFDSNGPANDNSILQAIANDNTASNGLIGAAVRLEDRDVVITATRPIDGADEIDLEIDVIDRKTRKPLLYRDPDSGEKVTFTLTILRKLFQIGKAAFKHKPENASERQGRYALMDPHAILDRDPKARWKTDLAQRALTAGTKLTDRECREFLEDNYGKEIGDFSYPKPSPSTLRRAMSKLRKNKHDASVLASGAGRPKGRSQLDPIIDALVHNAALFYWTRPRAQVVDAHAWLDDQIEKLKAKSGISSYKCPSKQTVYKRVDALRCYDTVKSKLGEKEAERRYRGSGENLVVNDLLDVVLMDATTLEQTIVFDEDWLLPACKVRIVALMCARSHAIVGCHIYAGPNRAQTSIEAVLDCLMPPNVNPEALKSMPALGWIFGKPRSILPDNEKALISAGTIDGFNEFGIDVLQPPIEMPTAKAVLERFFRFLKQALAQLPGTIVDPKRASEMGYNLVDACLTLEMLREVVASVITQHNISPSKGLGGQSPALVWQRLSNTRATPIFEDIDRARRILGRTVTVLLTRDGVEYNGIRYRDRELVTRLLDNMSHTQAKRNQRKDLSITIEMTARISPGNVDFIQLYDQLLEEWVVLPSTQPKYTANLSEWEHKEFSRMAAKRNEPFSSEKHRLESKMRTMCLIDKKAPELAFQQRRQMAALYQSQQVERVAGRSFSLPEGLNQASLALQETSETGRADTGVRGQTRTAAPARPEGYGGYAPNADNSDINWDNIPLDSDNDDFDLSDEGEAA